MKIRNIRSIIRAQAKLPTSLLTVCLLLLSVWIDGAAYPFELCPESVCKPHRNMTHRVTMLAMNEKTGETIRQTPPRLFMTPDGSLDSVGVPTLKGIREFIDQHPEEVLDIIRNPGQWEYLAVATGIIAGRDIVREEGGQPIPAHLRKVLRRWYPDNLLDSVRWTTVRGSVRRYLQDSATKFYGDTLAVTLIDVVIFQNDRLAEDGALWAHELYHVQQYQKWGVFGFARRWVKNSSIDGPIEAPAYARQAESQPFFKSR